VDTNGDGQEKMTTTVMFSFETFRRGAARALYLLRLDFGCLVYSIMAMSPGGKSGRKFLSRTPPTGRATTAPIRIPHRVKDKETERERAGDGGGGTVPIGPTHASFAAVHEPRPVASS
jgi:hypothetical protein